MNTKYYKCLTKNEKTIDNFQDKILEFYYVKVLENKMSENTFFEIYEKEKYNYNENQSYIVYIKANVVENKVVDLIINYYLKKEIEKKRLALFNKVYNVYVILETENFTNSVEKFLDHNIITPERFTRHWEGKIQIPISYVRNENTLYIANYYGNKLGKQTFYKREIELLLKNITENAFNVSVIQSKKNYREKNYYNTIFNEYSDDISNFLSSNINISIILTILACYILIETHNIYFYILVFAIIYFIMLLSYKDKVLRIIRKYEWIYIPNKSFQDLRIKMEEFLDKINFTKQKDGVFKKDNIYIVFCNQVSEYTSLYSSNSKIILITKENFNAKKSGIASKKIFVVQYMENNLLKILTPNNTILKLKFFEIIKKYYKKNR